MLIYKGLLFETTHLPEIFENIILRIFFLLDANTWNHITVWHQMIILMKWK